MKREEIRNFVKKFDHKDWYYYYDFDGIEVRPELQKVPDCGMNNWRKILPSLDPILSQYAKPRILDIGCNMGLYGYELWKRGAQVTGIDLNTDKAKFFQRYVNENLNEPYEATFIDMDVTKSKIPVGEVDIIFMFCVLYHLEPRHRFVLDNLPKHKHLIIQCNLPRVHSKKRGQQKLAGTKTVSSLMQFYKYNVSVHKLENYSKPLVIGSK